MKWPAPTFINADFDGEDHEVCIEWCIGEQRITLHAKGSILIRSRHGASQESMEDPAKIADALKAWLREAVMS